MGDPHAVGAPHGQRLGEEKLLDRQVDVGTGLMKLPFQGRIHGSIHLLAVLHNLGAANTRGVVIAHDEMDLVGILKLETDGVEQQLVGKTASRFIFRAAVDDFL